MPAELDTFSECAEINDLLRTGDERDARNRLIQLVDYHFKGQQEHPPYMNQLIRDTGLYLYLDSSTSSWQERFVCEAFRVNSGDKEERVMHREQSDVLRRLLDGESIAVSAPTSFGKTFIVDAFIATARPTNAMIIVPTIALMDEVRRRLHRKFGRDYKVITTTGATLSAKNLFVFPQERAIAYADVLESLDILVVDEFYKASSSFDENRSPALVKAIVELGKISKQRYYLTPNISSLDENPITRGMEFVDKLDFNTVFLEENHLYRQLKTEEEKGSKLIDLISNNPTKTLVYAASYMEVDKVVELLNSKLSPVERSKANEFSDWLIESYGSDWILNKAVLRGVGIHNGQIHRSVTQIQLRLFDLERDGLDVIVSTSSLIEGVNTAAESVVLWKNGTGGPRGGPRPGGPPLDSFMLKNIIGRGGRMFKYFVGKIYLLEAPPDDKEQELSIDFPESILGGIDETEHKEKLTPEQISKIIYYRERMSELLGEEGYSRLFGKAGTLQVTDSDLILKIANDMVSNSKNWNGLAFLNSTKPDDWERILYLLIKLRPGSWDISYQVFVKFVKVLSRNWEVSLPNLLRDMPDDVDIDTFFKLERNVTYKLATLLHDVNELQKVIDNGVDVAPFVTKLSHAFLPSAVYQLEEYGLPRMISRKIHRAGIFDFEEERGEVYEVFNALNEMGRDKIQCTKILSPFEKEVVDYFFDGISHQGDGNEGCGKR